MDVLNFLFRWAHLLFGITWIGLLYYFNFVQGGYFKQASPAALADAKAKLAPSALWWFRWGAMATFLTGVILLIGMHHGLRLNNYIVIGSTLGTLMFLNVWLVIWPNQKVALGLVAGDGATAGAKALLASRTNTLFSAPMAYCMLYSAHPVSTGYQSVYTDSGFQSLLIPLIVIALLEINALKGKQGPLTSVKGVIISSIALTAVLVGIVEIL